MYGVKESSVLIRLEYYHVVNGLSSDIAHYFFEGIIPDVLWKVLRDMASDGHITIDVLNERLAAFDFFTG